MRRSLKWQENQKRNVKDAKFSEALRNRTPEEKEEQMKSILNKYKR